MSAGSADNESLFVMLKYLCNALRVLFCMEKDELKSSSDFISLLRNRNWCQVLEGSGKGANKACLGYTPYEIVTVKNGAEEDMKHVRKQIGDDITFVELRMNHRMRVHGFRVKAAFFLFCWIAGIGFSLPDSTSFQ